MEEILENDMNEKTLPIDGTYKRTFNLKKKTISIYIYRCNNIFYARIRKTVLDLCFMVEEKRQTENNMQKPLDESDYTPQATFWHCTDSHNKISKNSRNLQLAFGFNPL